MENDISKAYKFLKAASETPEFGSLGAPQQASITEMMGALKKILYSAAYKRVESEVDASLSAK